jgi:hypothetical protein
VVAVAAAAEAVVAASAGVEVEAVVAEGAEPVVAGVVT